MHNGRIKSNCVLSREWTMRKSYPEKISRTTANYLFFFFNWFKRYMGEGRGGNSEIVDPNKKIQTRVFYFVWKIQMPNVHFKPVWESKICWNWHPEWNSIESLEATHVTSTFGKAEKCNTYHHISLQSKASITDSWSFAFLIIFLRFVFLSTLFLSHSNVWCVMLSLRAFAFAYTIFFFVTQFWYCINMDFSFQFTIHFQQFLFSGDVSSWSFTIIRNFIHCDEIPAKLWAQNNNIFFHPKEFQSKQKQNDTKNASNKWNLKKDSTEVGGVNSNAF